VVRVQVRVVRKQDRLTMELEEYKEDEVFDESDEEEELAMTKSDMSAKQEETNRESTKIKEENEDVKPDMKYECKTRRNKQRKYKDKERK